MYFTLYFLEPEWLQLSCSEVALGIIFILVGVYITTHINGLRTDIAYKRNIRRSLWGYVRIYVYQSKFIQLIE